MLRIPQRARTHGRRPTFRTSVITQKDALTARFLFAPWIGDVFSPAPRGIFPLGFRREPATKPCTILLRFRMCPDGVTVSTLDFESSDGGSNPPWTYFYFRTRLGGSSNKKTTPMGFEPMRAKPIGFRVQLLNHSDTVSVRLTYFCEQTKIRLQLSVIAALQKNATSDSSGVRTHALSDQRLKLAP